jgi:Flp pilus assembly protein TadB
MATTAFVLLLLAVLVRLGRPRGPLAASDLLAAALHGVLVLSRLSDRRRERLRGALPHAQDADHGVAARSNGRAERGPCATTA